MPHPFLSPDQQVGPFQIVEEIGRGSSSAVYAARHRGSGEEVALKWLLSRRETASLKREFRIAKSLRHPSVVDLYELYDDDVGLFFTMRRVFGCDVVTHCLQIRDLEQRARKVELLFGQLADGLCCLHDASLLHRDIKPANVLVDASDRVVLVDFGLARPIRAAAPRGFSGTLLYAAPERLLGKPATPGSDWYSFGVLMVQAILGHLPASLHRLQAGLASEREHRLPFSLGAGAEYMAATLTKLLDPVPSRRGPPAELLHAAGSRRATSAASMIIGGERTLTWLASRLANAGPQLLIVEGPGGIGKTTLVRAALQRTRDVLVLSSRCHPRERIAFNALDAIAIGLLEELEHAVDASCPEVELIRCMFAGQRAVSPATTLAEIASAFAQLLALASARRGVVVWIDDAQWMDRDSREVLTHLLRARTASITWLLSTRDDAQAMPFSAGDLECFVHRVCPLSDAEQRALLDALAPDISAVRAALLCTLSEGLPLRLTQLAAWHSSCPVACVPPAFPYVLTQLAEGWPPVHRELLNLLAVHHSRLDRDVLACVGVSPRFAYDLLEAGLLEFERSGQRDLLALRDDQLRGSVTRGVSAEAKASYHRTLARALGQVLPDHCDAIFQHLRDGGLLAEAFEPGLRSAHQLERSGAFHAASERYRWLARHARSELEACELSTSLAVVLSKAGEALEAGEVYLAQVPRVPAPRRADIRRAASEQLLRAADVGRGRKLLDECLREAGIRLPRSLPLQLADVLRQRVRVRAQRLEHDAPRAPSRAVNARIEVAWSAGLSLSLIDIVSSSLVQARFTDLALRHGTLEQRARALAVEYSYTMLTGGRLSSRRRQALLHAIDRIRPRLDDPYTHAIVDLSIAAGDYFRGALGGVEPLLRSARARFTHAISQKSWELANCGMYESWTALERGDLAELGERVPELLRLGTSRGDRLYRQCFVGGYCATAWLVRDRPAELLEQLEALGLPAGTFQMAHFFELLARVRLELYCGRFTQAWRRVADAWPSVRRSGFLFLRWPRFALLTLAAQAALGARSEPGAAAAARSTIRDLGRIEHPVASAWQQALHAVLVAPEQGRHKTLAALEGAERAFAARQFLTTANAVRHLRGQLGADVDRAWAGVQRPDALAQALAFPLNSAMTFPAR